jgi:hypothetical protein
MEVVMSTPDDAVALSRMLELDEELAKQVHRWVIIFTWRTIRPRHLQR